MFASTSMYRTQSLPLGAPATGALSRTSSAPVFASLDFGSVGAARKHYAASQPSHIQVVVVEHNSTKEALPMKVPLHRLKADCFYFVAYNLLLFKATPWGYLDRIGMKYMKVEEEHLVVFRSSCYEKPRASIGVEEKQMHKSFDVYTSWPRGDANMAYIEEALRRRIVMYIALSKDPQEAEPTMLRDGEAVHMDQLSYHLVLISLFHYSLRLHDVKKQWYLLSKWVEMENEVVRHRLQQVHPSRLLHMLGGNDCDMVDASKAPPGFATLYDKETECYRMPFEVAAPLMRSRRVVLRGGWAYAHRMDLQLVVLCFARSLNQRNCDKYAQMAIGGGLEPVFKDKRIAGFAIGIIRHLCHITQANVGSSPQMQLSVKHMTQHAPPCMVALLDKGYNLKNKHHLKVNDRMLLGTYMIQSGASGDAVVDGWSIKMRQVYELSQYPKEVKSLYSMMQWLERHRKGKTPLSCKQVMSCNHCPFGQTIDAQRRCGEKHGVVTRNPSHYLQVALEHEAASV